jgi:hypothetical protein
MQVQFAVGFKIQGKTGHVVVDAEDALIAALKVKMQRPEALIAYVRQQNKLWRHPSPHATTWQRQPLGYQTAYRRVIFPNGTAC